MDEKHVHIRCRDVRGRLRTIGLTEVDLHPAPGSVLEQRLVKSDNGQLLVRKFVPREAGQRNPALYDRLENEVRAGSRLGQVYADRYPPELARLFGYDMDADEPFALLGAYTGQPPAQLVGRFDEAERRRFQISLLRALHLTATAGIVHGAVTLDSVRWDGSVLQLVDFESAEMAGDPRRRGVGSPVHSPEQNDGTGVVDVRDDIWAAGLLIRESVMGSFGGAYLDPRQNPDHLRALLAGVFEPVGQRPYAVDLLARLRAGASIPFHRDPMEELAEGHERFEQVSRTKRGEPPAEPMETSRTVSVPASANTEPAGQRWALPLVVMAIVVAALIIGVTVVMG